MNTSRHRWNARYEEHPEVGDPAPFLLSVAGHVPSTGTAVDVAGGSGRNAIWLADRGLAVTLIDVSDVGLQAAASAASAAGVDLDLVQRDLEADGWPAGTWDLALFHRYYDRAVLLATVGHLSPGGLLLFAQPTVRNLERHENPRREFLVEEGEVAALAAGMGLQIIELTEGWTDEGSHEARLVAQTPT